MQEYRTYQQDDDLTKYCTKVNEKEIINPEFYNYVMDDVDESLTGVALAYAIYSSLNRKVSYDENFIAFGSEYDFLINKNINSVTINNSSVICDIWAPLFAICLEKRGFSAVVNKEATHSKVYFKAEGFIICADATENKKDLIDGFDFSDITRCKLGLVPNNFLVYEKDKNNQMVAKKITDTNWYKDSGVELSEPIFSKQITKLLELLNQNPTYKKYKSKNSSLESDFDEINHLLKESELDTISSIMYLNNLIKILLSKDDQARITKDYIKVQKDENISLGLLINYCPPETKQIRYCDFHPCVNGINFLYTNADGICEISEDEAYNLQAVNDDIELNIDKYIISRKGGK